MNEQQFSLAAQMEEVQRELAMRERAYPGFVRSHRMKQNEADYHLARMRAVLRTLHWLRDNEQRIRKALELSDT